jgi:uncharacterized NAD(P)/FAD-binding protein YdhS
MPQRIAIVGAGFSGTLTAINLLRIAAGWPLEVVLIEASGRPGRGVAYGTARPEHLLNVPAGNMSALADDPDDFLRYCRWADPAVGASSFVARRRFGAYLEALLGAAEMAAPDGVVFTRRTGAVQHIGPPSAPGARATLRLAGGEAIEADRVVLATGHAPPAVPAAIPADVRDSARFVADPWCPGALDAIGPADDVLLLGSGLTAIDAVLSLHGMADDTHAPRTGRTTCVSRRGLVPTAHRERRDTPDPELGALVIEKMGSGTRAGLAAVRFAIERHAAAGRDWRDVIGALRPHTPALWQRLPEAERRRFLRHVQPWWDMARHRCAPAVHARFQALRARGAVEVLAGRLIGAAFAGEGLAVRVRPRGGPAPGRVLHPRFVVNCTGPSTAPAAAPGPLLPSLLAAGLVRADALGLGLDVNAEGALLDAEGRASRWLHGIGPMLKARDWEAVAVPELRVHARRLAQRLLRG